MKSRDLQAVLDDWDRLHQKWVFNIHDLANLFPQDTPCNLHNQLCRLTRNGILRRVARGVYANHRARSRRLTIYTLARHLRPRELLYISRETRLCELGIIPQQVLDYLTLTTHGRSYLFRTPYGRIEYTHTERSFEDVERHIRYNPFYGLFEADAELALRDLRTSRRNLGLVREPKQPT